MGSLYVTIPSAYVRMNFRLEGLFEVMECIFRDDPESIKEKQEKQEKEARKRSKKG